MTNDDLLIRKYALRRLAKVFNIAEDQLTESMRFSNELKASARSDFTRNEFDLIDEDIKDVADKETRTALANGNLEIVTVQDYCDHMVLCNATKPKEVAQVLDLPPS